VWSTPTGDETAVSAAGALTGCASAATGASPSFGPYFAAALVIMSLNSSLTASPPCFLTSLLTYFVSRFCRFFLSSAMVFLP
jgi:hypothetical protein